MIDGGLVGAIAIGVFVVALLTPMARNSARVERARRRFGRDPLVPAHPGAAPPAALAALGLTEPVATTAGDHEVSARGVIDGVVVLGRCEVPTSHEDPPPPSTYRLVIPLADIVPRELHLAAPGVRSRVMTLELGDHRFDRDVVVVAPRALAVLHLDARARDALRIANVGEWSFEGDRLHRSDLDEASLARALVLGLAAARALRIDGDPAVRLARTATSDPVPLMRQRALSLLVTQHPDHAATCDAVERARASDDPVLALIADASAASTSVWLERASSLMRDGHDRVVLREHLSDLGVDAGRLSLTTSADPSGSLTLTSPPTRSDAGDDDGNS